MIKGNNITLRVLERPDLANTVKWFNDEQITQPLERLPFMTYDQEEKWYQVIQENDQVMVFAIINQKNEHIGNISLNSIDYKNSHALIALAIGDKHSWGKGYGTDAVNTLVNYAFNELNIHKIYTHIISSNKGSIKIFQKLDFLQEGELKDWYFSKGEYHSRIIMSLINPKH